MKLTKIDYLCLAMVVTSFVVTAVFYQRLPEQTPVHWGFEGTADSYAAKPTGPFVAPLISAGLLALFLVLPRISPVGFRIDPFMAAYRQLQLTLQVLLFAFCLLLIASGVGVAVPINSVVVVGAGLLILAVGNLMGKFRKNFFVGIRTPWTLASDEVWLRTHRLAGWLMVAAGVYTIFAGVTGVGVAWFAALVIAAVLVPAAYSYFAYRQLLRTGRIELASDPEQS